MLQHHYLDDFFNPDTIAVIGASDHAESIGFKVVSNLLQSGFKGSLFPVNPSHASLFEKKCYASVLDIPDKIDLAVVMTKAQRVPDIIKQCGEKGIHSVIIISAGFSEMGKEGVQLEQSILDIAEKYQIRFVGPNCLGVMRPSSYLNATFDNNFALPGNMALVSQSGAICAAILDWAMKKDIGFSTIISMGNSINLDFGDMLDYLALDPLTKSILLYIEGIHFPRRFLSGLRSAARIKPVIVLKAGRSSKGVRAVHSHTGSLVGDDAIFTAALNRGGAVRVDTIEQLFTAAQVLSSQYHSKGNRLTVITNGGGAGVMAADCALREGVDLAELGDSTLTELNSVLPAHWSHQNPVDILGDATPERYRQVLETCLTEKNSDGLLTILVPVAMSKPYEVAKEVVTLAKKTDKPFITCWMGDKQSEKSWKYFADHHIPCYQTPEVAVEAFSYLAGYAHNQQLLLQVPEPRFCSPELDAMGAELIINAALSEQRKLLNIVESKAILHAFAIPVSQTLLARTANEALIAAESLGFPVAMKINSPDITHKQDVGGVQLNIANGEMIRSAFNHMMENAKASQPTARLDGVTIEKMVKTKNDRELMIGVIRDKVFGPVISLGLGGSLVEVIHDYAVALPPLNAFLANQLIERTQAKKILDNFRGKLPVNKAALIDILLRVSDMVCELPQIQEMDINPLIINDKEAIAVDARMVVDYSNTSKIRYSHMAIHPYPTNLISTWQTPDGVPITIRPIRPEDAKAEQEFVDHLSLQAKYFRFMHEFSELTPEALVRFTQIDYESEMALVATIEEQPEKIIGIARYYTQADLFSCEFALVVADAWNNKGIGTRLMLGLMETAKQKGIKTMSGRILAENSNMLELVKHLHFTVRTSDDPTIKIAIKKLD